MCPCIYYTYLALGHFIERQLIDEHVIVAGLYEDRTFHRERMFFFVFFSNITVP